YAWGRSQAGISGRHGPARPACAPSDRCRAASDFNAWGGSGAGAVAGRASRHPGRHLCVDLSAFGALTECARRGVRVPDDIAVAGFGDYDIALICVPTQTTINPFPALIGEHTAELILSLRDG